MKIGLIDVDSHNFPNIPLMKLSAWHKRNGDDVEWYNPLISGRCDRVYISKVFSFSPDFDWCIDADEIIQGGSGYAITLRDGKEIYQCERDPNLPDEIEHIFPDYSLYQIDQTAYGFLTRGCPRNCGFCHVSQKEGTKSYKVANLSEFWNGQKNIVLCDPNILACSEHIELLEQCAESGSTIELNQGLDVRLMTDANIDVLKRIKLDHVHIAYDRIQDKSIIEPRMEAFAKLTGFDRHKGNTICYILVNFDTSIEQDIERIQFCRSLNIAPFPMIYDKEHSDPIYRKLQRWCNNWIFWKVPTFGEYLRGYNNN